jgi:hypothetical protein
MGYMRGVLEREEIIRVLVPPKSGVALRFPPHYKERLYRPGLI